MENRVVALSVLEDLAHWPLSTQLTSDNERSKSGSRAESNTRLSKSRSKEATLTESIVTSYDAVAVSNTQMPSTTTTTAPALPSAQCMAYDAEEEVTSEPVERKQARYAAVLLLPLLCQKLGPRWVQSEIVPYLLRCLEEEDARLTMAVGVTVLGLVLPRTAGSTLYPLYTTTANTSPSPAATTSTTTTTKLKTDKATTPAPFSSSSYLSLDAVQPVLVALSCSREEGLRDFAAQVILPHVCFGIALRQPPDDLLQNWDSAYLPPPGLQEVGWGTDTLKPSNMFTVMDNEVHSVAKDKTLVNDTTHNTMQEAWDFLCHPLEATLHPPRTPLLSTDDDEIMYSSFVIPTGDDTNLENTSVHGSELLEHASLDLYGAAYARSRQPANNGSDRFELILRARTLRQDIHQWLVALVPDAEKTPTASPSSTTTMMSYFDTAARREALRLRWKFLLKLLRVLLETPCASASATAVGSIGAVVQALTWYRTYLRHTQSFERASQSGRHADPCAEQTAKDERSEVKDVWTWLAQVMHNAQPRDEAELRSFTYASVRCHVALAIAAAVAPTPRIHGILHNNNNNTTSTRAASTTSDINAQLEQLIDRALVTAQGTLMALLYEHRILQRNEDIEDSNDNGTRVMWGCGPVQFRAYMHSAWDIGLATEYDDEEGGDDEQEEEDVTQEKRAATTPTTSLSRLADAPLPPRTPLHRLTLVAMIHALPGLLSWAPLLSSSSTLPVKYGRAASSRADSSEREEKMHGLTLGEACTLLRRLLIPPSLWLLYEQEKDITSESIDCGNKEENILIGVTNDGMQLREDSMASSDYAVIEAILGTVQQFCAQLALWLPSYLLRQESCNIVTALLYGTTHSATESSQQQCLQRVIKSYTGELWGLVRVCLQLVPRYAAWKARWGLAVRLPGLIASYTYLCVRLHEALMHTTSDEDTISALTALLQGCLRSVMDTLLEAYRPLPTPRNTTTTNESQNTRGVTSCRGVLRACILGTSEEETEVRVVALKAAASIIAALVQATRRLSAVQVHEEKNQERLLGQHNTTSTQFTSIKGIQQAMWPSLEPLIREVYSLCQDSLGNDLDEQVRSAAAIALANLTRSLMSIESITGVARPSLGALRQACVESLASAAAADRSSAVQLVLVAELSEVLLSQAAHAAYIVSRQVNESEEEDSNMAAEVNKVNGSNSNSNSTSSHNALRALLDGLRALEQHEMWRIRERYAWLLGHLCLRCLLLARQGAYSFTYHTMKANNTLTSSRTSEAAPHKMLSAATADALVNEELLPLLVAVLFDKVKAVRDAALRATAHLCRVLNTQQQQQQVSTSSVRVTDSKDSFASARLWPLLQHDEKAWQTYLSRTALLHIVTLLGMDKASIVLPLLVQLAEDTVPNVRLAVAKTLRDVLRGQLDVDEDDTLSEGDTVSANYSTSMNNAASLSDKTSQDKEGTTSNGDVKTSVMQSRGNCLRARGKRSAEYVDVDPVAPVVFTEEEKNGVVLTLLRQLLADGSRDVRDEAAEALRVCF